jgi:transcriptional regulator with XRE-family HTH domain
MPKGAPDLEARARIGRNIRSRRRELDLSQDDVAQASGVSRGAVSQWESGIMDVDATKFAALAHVLKTSIEKLLGVEQLPPTDGIKGSPYLFPEVRQVIAMLNSMSPEESIQFFETLRDNVIPIEKLTKSPPSEQADPYKFQESNPEPENVSKVAASRKSSGI